jgi:hypothetical protein
MYNFEELISEITADSKIDQTNLESEIVKCTSLIAKYLRIHRKYKEGLIQMWAKRDATTLEKQEYYAGRALDYVYKNKPFNLEVKNAVEMKRWMEGDLDLLNMNKVILSVEDQMEKVEMMLEQLKYRPNHIQTILQIRMFESGA